MTLRIGTTHRAHLILVVGALLAVMTAPALGHVGSPDVFYEGLAGPYRVLIVLRPPQVAPGKVRIEVRSEEGDIRAVAVTALHLTGAGSQTAPMPDRAISTSEDPHLFVGSLWLTMSGSWQVRVQADGPRGWGEVAVPVPELPDHLKAMGPGLGLGLFLALLVLGAGAVSLIKVANRDGVLEPGAAASRDETRRSQRVAWVAAAILLLAVFGADRWWTESAARYEQRVYKPLRLRVSTASPGALDLTLEDPGWVDARRLDDFIPDHGHLMHLFLIRVPELDALGHLHPRQTGVARFAQDLPDLPPGRYQLFADVVHATGLPETPIAEVSLPPTPGGALAGDDSMATGLPFTAAEAHTWTSPLSDGGRMIWEQSAGRLVAGEPIVLRFRIEDREGVPSTSLEPYMGMPGHAVVVSADRAVFAHLHSFGSPPMAALAIAQASLEPPGSGSPHMSHGAGVGPVISFPYGFPKPGHYRVFVQVKRSGRIETGIFDLDVAA